MSVAEMKVAAIIEISKLQSEAAVKEILEHLAKISGEINTPFDSDVFFKEASSKYDDVLKKLSE